MEPFSFEKLPEVIRILFEKVEHIEELLQDLQAQSPNENELLTIQEAAEFLKVTCTRLIHKSKQTGDPSKQTR
ncbi:MAG: hypothetical protein ACOH2V_08250 [Candidatus Saccharimonadaceae bacterium]